MVNVYEHKGKPSVVSQPSYYAIKVNVHEEKRGEDNAVIMEEITAVSLK